MADNTNLQEQLKKLQQEGKSNNLQGLSDATRTALNQYSLGYQQSQKVTDAENYLQKIMDQKPGEYKSQYQGQIQGLYDQIMNRPKFNYNMNADPIYQQYKDQYMRNGRRAMQDTVGNVAGLTGGYGNSYALAAGQQQYNDYLSALNAVMPDLYQKAYDRYNQEGADMRSNLAMAMGLDDTDYGRYRDTVGDWQNERAYAQQTADNAYNRDFTQYSQMLDYWTNMAGAENGEYWNNLNFRSSAYSQAMDMMARGILPGNDILSQAGLTPEQAQAYMAQLNAAKGGGTQKPVKDNYTWFEQAKDKVSNTYKGVIDYVQAAAKAAVNAAKTNVYGATNGVYASDPKKQAELEKILGK